MADETLTIRIVGDTSSYEKAVEKAEKTTGSFESKMSRISKKVKDVGKSISDFGKKLTVVSTGIVTAAGAGVKYNATVEQLETSFAVMTGSAEEAAEVVERLQKLGAATPFEFTDLAETTQLLMNYGFAADEAIDSMEMLGDISQGSAEKMTRIATAYGQMSSAGKVSLEDVKQMIEAGFNPLREISDSTGESMESLYDRISKGTISVDEITASMQRATSEGGMYFQSMEKQSQTFNGQMSTLSDNAKSFLGNITGGIFERLAQDVLPKINEAISGLNDAFQSGGFQGMVDYIKQLSPTLDTVITKAEQVAQVFNNMGIDPAMFAGIVVSAGPAIMILGKLVSVVGTVVSGIGKLNMNIVAMGGLKSIIGGVFSAITSPATLVIGAIMAVVAAFTHMMKTSEEFRSSVMSLVGSIQSSMQPAIEAMRTAISNIVATVAPVIQSLISQLVPVLAQIGMLVMEIVAAIAPLISQLITSLMPVIENIIAVVMQIIQAVMPALIAIINVVMDVIRAIMPVIQSVLSVVMDVVSAIIEAISPIITFIGEVISKIMEIITPIITFIGGLLSGVIGTIIDVISAIYNFIKETNEKIMAFVTPIIERIMAIIRPIVEFVKGIIAKIMEILQPIIAFFQDLSRKIMDVVGGVFSKIVGVVTSIRDFINGVNEKIIGAVSGAVSKIANVVSTVRETFSNVFNKVHDIVSSVMEKVRGVISGVFDKIKGAWSGLTGFVSGIFDGIKDAVGSLIDKVKGAVNNVTGGINSAIDIINKIPGVEIPLIPQLLHGTDYWQGGFAYMNEGGRGELTYLPNGSQVIPHDISVQYAKEAARENAGGEMIDIEALGEYIVSAMVQYGNRQGEALEKGISNMGIYLDDRQTGRVLTKMGFVRG